MGRRDVFREDGHRRNGGLLGPVVDHYAVRANMVLCPYCQKRIHKDAVKCGFCNEWLVAPEDAPKIVELNMFRERKRSSTTVALWAGGFLVLVALALSNSGGGTDAAPPNSSSETSQSVLAVGATAGDAGAIAVQFGSCHTGGGTNCVVDGDTFWLNGVKFRMSDIDAPETHPSRCAREAELGSHATDRLRQLLNAGPITLEGGSRDADRYGRKLRVVSRDGHSLGMMLVNEGLAREWTGRQEPWC